MVQRIIASIDASIWTWELKVHGDLLRLADQTTHHEGSHCLIRTIDAIPSLQRFEKGFEGVLRNAGPPSRWDIPEGNSCRLQNRAAAHKESAATPDQEDAFRVQLEVVAHKLGYETAGDPKSARC